MNWLSAIRPRRAPAPPGERSNTYKRIWNLYARQDAKKSIFTNATDESFESSGRADAERIARLVSKDAMILNIGCGIGRVEKYLAPRVRELHAVDISRKMIALAKRRLSGLPNVFLREVAPDEYLSAYGDETFDLVFSLLVLQHTEREHAFTYLQHAHRVLKPGGTLFVQFPNFLSPEYTSTFLDPVVLKHLSASRVRCYTQDEVRHLLGMLGFEIRSLTLEAGREGNAEIYVTGTRG
ncbi:MAG: class I SAM-dependent methyltransferase [Thermoanaerobaculia bacterium]